MAKKSAFGTTIGKNGATALAYVRAIRGPGISLDTADVTTHDSTAAWEEVVATILRTGEVTVEIDYDPANATHKNLANGFLALLVARAAVTWDIILPGPSTISFSGFAVGFEPDAPHDGALTASLRIKPTAAVTLP
jgi:predicted secreted protein